MNRITVAAVCLAASSSAFAGPKWDASMKACSDAYDTILIANSRNPALDMSGAPDNQTMNAMCLQAGESFRKRTDFSPYVAGTYFTSEEYGQLALRLAAAACAQVSYTSRGVTSPPPSRDQIMGYCEKRLATFDRSK